MDEAIEDTYQDRLERENARLRAELIREQCGREQLREENERRRTYIRELENDLIAGVHTCSPTCHKTPACAARADLREENERLRAQIDALQARLDALMLELCRDGMTKEQKETWARHQQPARRDGR